ncbi:beta-mannosidase [Flavimobilis soli]|uniref:beta-mannosidase n=1 Tax=Flavimobilis soli TaxID=442709 RepID=A0A2A9EFD3_9MICO|nr:beta-mannosidase [Flavimobilis soli]PFG36939.1 beta-mannosidase [Flavimobilis soli]
MTHSSTFPTPALSAQRVRDLHDGWRLRAVSGPVPEHVATDDVPATVPGSVHTDLLAAGRIPDPYLDDNERVLAWIGRTSWEYRTTFAWAPDGRDRHDLVFEGLDTFATVTLNGVHVATTANMHRSCTLDVREALREGNNELVVTFAAPVPYADAQSLALGYRPQTGNTHPFNAVRKMACSFGWDWGIDTATSGIWKPVRLRSWSTARLATVRTEALLPDGATEGARGVVRVSVEVERVSDAPLQLCVAVGSARTSVEVPAGETTASADVMLEAVALWWPRTHGAQPLYDVAVTLETADGTALDAAHRRVGFRTVRLEMEPDADGTSFTFVVNDEPVWIRGANWIPDDAFPHRVTRERYAARVDQAAAANMNLLRVWGGGIYESEDFYDACDERGLLVWQDFPFACAAYSEEEPLRSEVEAEARENVARLAHRASLALLNGSNENIWGYADWRWEERLDGRSWGIGYYLELLPAIVAELAPGTAYTPSSPWSGSMDVHPNDPSHGAMHSWEAWNRQPMRVYRDDVPRFMAEYGWQGPPTWATLTRAISDSPLTPDSPGMVVHQKAAQGNDKLAFGLVPHFPLPTDMDLWHWAMSLNQARALRVGIGHLRSHAPVCMGSVVWQLNDCWPVTSWAAVDGDGRPKPLFYELAHQHADRLVTVQPREDGLVVALHDDSAVPWIGTLTVRRLTFDGQVLAEHTHDVEVPARGIVTLQVPDDVATPSDPAAELIVASLGDDRATWFFAEPREARLPEPAFDVTTATRPGATMVTVTTDALVVDLALLVDKIHPDARVDDMLVTLLPGESVTFTVTAPIALDAAALADPRVLRHAGQLVDRRI